MKHWLTAGLLAVCLSGVVAAASGPEVLLVDNKLSINADSISLGRLLRLLDLATGMQSKVPPELANRNISVKFSGLSVEDGIHKIFQGLPLDYVTVAGQGVIVTAASQAGTQAEAPAAYNPPMQAQQPPQQPIDQPFNQDFPPVGQPGMPNIPGQPVQMNQPQQQPA